MKKLNIKSPVGLMIVFCDKNREEDVERYLFKNNLKLGVIMKGEGTTESEIADIFGFGMMDKSVILSLIPTEKKDKILKDITDITGIESDSYGLAMFLNITSATNIILNNMGIKLGE